MCVCVWLERPGGEWAVVQGFPPNVSVFVCLSVVLGVGVISSSLIYGNAQGQM